MVAAAAHQKTRFIVTFEGIDDARGGRAAGAASCSRPRASTTTSVIWIDQLYGAEVLRRQDGHARGVVVDVEANPASDLLVLDSGALVPLTFVIAVEANARVDVDAPEGLFE